MLLVIDVGNTNTVLGLYREDRLVKDWRICSDKGRTADEYAVLINELFGLFGIALDEIEDAIISCVVPPMLRALQQFCSTYFRRPAYVVGPGIKTGMPILYDNPKEVGADRIVNAVAAFEKYARALIVVDFGTATTFDYISAKGQYLGGAIAPGIGISSEALFQAASKLPRVEFVCPSQVVAKNTVGSMQAGIFFGYVGLVDGIVERMKRELNELPLVVATGGLATLIAPQAQSIDAVESDLTLDGLAILYGRNREHPPL